MKWIGGVSLVAIVVGVAATMTIPAQTVTPDLAILKLLPAATQGVAFIDAAALRNTPLVQDLMAEGQLPVVPPKLRDFAATTGFDFQRDIDRITIGRLENRRMLLVFEARYDKFKVERFLSDHVSRLEAYMGRDIYEDRDIEAGVAFIDNVVIAGYIEAVKKAIEQASLPASGILLRSDLLTTIRTIEAGNQVWGVGEFHFEELPLNRVAPQGTGPVLEILRTLQGGTYQMRIDRDIHARATGNFTNADNAKTIAGLGRGMVALMKTQVAKQQDLLYALDGVQISNSGTSVVVNIDESGDLVKKLREWPRRPPLQGN
jgi:hypothetical protein